MTRFLRLTNMLLNVNQIRLIEITPDKYTIRMNSHKFGGGILSSAQAVLIHTIMILIVVKNSIQQIIKLYLNGLSKKKIIMGK